MRTTPVSSRARASIIVCGTVVPPRRSHQRGIDAPAPEHAPRHDSAMTADRKSPPKYARVAVAVRSQIADGTLRPGEPAPSGAALSRATGYSTLTCRKALRQLIADGLLTPRTKPQCPPPRRRPAAASGRTRPRLRGARPGDGTGGPAAREGAHPAGTRP